MRFNRIARLVGTLTVFLGLSMLFPALISALYGEWMSVASFGLAIAITVLAGAGLWWLGRGEMGTIFRREALLVVGISWLFAGVFGGLPFLIEGVFRSPIDSFFETISGFTTTGATVLVDIESPGISHGIHFWRCFTHWLGGIGIVVLFVAIFPQLGVGGKLLFKSEIAGPITEGLRPKIRETSRVLFRIYLSLTLACFTLLVIAGMSPFEAAAHSFSTMGTGGFSTRAASVAAFDSAAIDAIITVFMILAGTNFGIYYAMVRGGGPRRALRNEELWVYLIIILVVSVFMTIDIVGRHATLLQDFRYAVFQVASIVTTTGFVTDDFNLYPTVSRTLFFMIFFVGSMAGSTGGGLKTIRAIVLFKAGVREVVHTFRPQAVSAIKLGRSNIATDTERMVFAFFVLYVATFAAGALIMSTMTEDIITAMTATIACLGNVGPGLEDVGAIENYAFFPGIGKLVLSTLMVLGRLELFTLLVLLVPAFWRK